MDADAINVFTWSTTCKVLVHTLRREASRMMQELQDVATKYAMGEEVVLDNFSDKDKASAHHSGGDDDNGANMVGQCHNKKKDKKRRGEETVAVADPATHS
jgi:hypothetical protein